MPSDAETRATRALNIKNKYRIKTRVKYAQKSKVHSDKRMKQRQLREQELIKEINSFAVGGSSEGTYD